MRYNSVSRTKLATGTGAEVGKTNRSWSDTQGIIIQGGHAWEIEGYFALSLCNAQQCFM